MSINRTMRPERAFSSAMRVIGRRKWALVRRRPAETMGAAVKVLKMKAIVPTW